MTAIVSSAAGQCPLRLEPTAGSPAPTGLLQGCKEYLQGSADSGCKDAPESHDSVGVAQVSQPKLRTLLPESAVLPKYRGFGWLCLLDKGGAVTARLQGWSCKSVLQGTGGEI